MSDPEETIDRRKFLTSPQPCLAEVQRSREPLFRTTGFWAPTIVFRCATSATEVGAGSWAGSCLS